MSRTGRIGRVPVRVTTQRLHEIFWSFTDDYGRAHVAAQDVARMCEANRHIIEALVKRAETEGRLRRLAGTPHRPVFQVVDPATYDPNRKATHVAKRRLAWS